jgi:hypothetical protein
MAFAILGLKAFSVSLQSGRMNAGRWLGGWVVVALLCACGSARRAAEAPADPEGGGAGGAAGDALHAEPSGPAGRRDGAGQNADAPAPVANGELGLPTRCTPVGDLCLPPRGFVQRLCRDAYGGAAIRLFEKSSPFSRGYVRSREVQAVNTLGGPSSDDSLRFAEEVLILTRTGGAGPGEMQVSGMGGYDVLRWDGTCATLADGELAMRAPVPARYAPFSWRYIDTNIQNALLSNSDVEAARREHKKHCHGVSLGRISAACAKAESELRSSIVAAVRGGISLPDPERMP